MKSLTIHFTPELERRLKQAFTVRTIVGSATGIPDAFVSMILQKLEDGDPEWTPTIKEKK